jgi:hypothetical protein
VVKIREFQEANRLWSHYLDRALIADCSLPNDPDGEAERRFAWGKVWFYVGVMAGITGYW